MQVMNVIFVEKWEYLQKTFGRKAVLLSHVLVDDFVWFWEHQNNHFNTVTNTENTLTTTFRASNVLETKNTIVTA